MTSYSPKHATMASSEDYQWLKMTRLKDEKGKTTAIRFTETYKSGSDQETIKKRKIPLDEFIPYIWTCYRLFVFKSQSDKKGKKGKNIIPPFFIDTTFRKDIDGFISTEEKKQWDDYFKKVINKSNPFSPASKRKDPTKENWVEIGLEYVDLMNKIFGTPETVNSRIVTQQQDGRPLHLDPSSLEAGRPFESKDEILKAIYEKDYGLSNDEELKHNRFNPPAAQEVEKKPAPLYEIRFKKYDRQWFGSSAFKNQEYVMDAPIRGQAVNFNGYSIWAQAQRRLPWRYALAYFRFHIYVLRDMYLSSEIPEEVFQILIKWVQDPFSDSDKQYDENILNQDLKMFFEYLKNNKGYKAIMEKTPNSGHFLMPMTKRTPYVKPEHIYEAFKVEMDDASKIPNTVLYQQIEKYFNKDYDNMEMYVGAYNSSFIQSLKEDLGKRQAEIDDLAVRLSAAKEELNQLQTKRHDSYGNLRTRVDRALKDANEIRNLLAKYEETGKLKKDDVLSKIDTLIERFDEDSFKSTVGSTETPYNEEGQGKRKNQLPDDGLSDPKKPRGSDESDQAGSAARIKSGVNLILTAAKAFEKYRIDDLSKSSIFKEGPSWTFIQDFDENISSTEIRSKID